MLSQRRNIRVNIEQAALNFLHLSRLANSNCPELQLLMGRHQHKQYFEHIHQLQLLQLNMGRLRDQLRGHFRLQGLYLNPEQE